MNNRAGLLHGLRSACPAKSKRNDQQLAIAHSQQHRFFVGHNIHYNDNATRRLQAVAYILSIARCTLRCTISPIVFNGGVMRLLVHILKVVLRLVLGNLVIPRRSRKQP